MILTSFDFAIIGLIFLNFYNIQNIISKKFSKKVMPIFLGFIFIVLFISLGIIYGNYHSMITNTSYRSNDLFIIGFLNLLCLFPLEFSQGLLFRIKLKKIYGHKFFQDELTVKQYRWINIFNYKRTFKKWDEEYKNNKEN